MRRSRRYGTIVCDLERRRIVALLPDREKATVQAWLSKHPGINIVSRDRGGGYGEAAAKALPNAIQVTFVRAIRTSRLVQDLPDFFSQCPKGKRLADQIDAGIETAVVDYCIACVACCE